MIVSRKSSFLQFNSNFYASWLGFNSDDNGWMEYVGKKRLMNPGAMDSI